MTVADALRSAQARDDLGFLTAAVRAELVRREAARRGITITRGELQAAADEERRRLRLFGAAATMDWLQERRLDVDSWERALEDVALTAKVRDAVTAVDVEPYFEAHRAEFDRATLSRIVVVDEGIAAELQLIIVEEGEDFADLARRYSIDQATRRAGGYVGPVWRRQLPAHVGAVVFAAEEGDVVGPVPVGTTWQVLLVEHVDAAVLDDSCQEAVVSELFDGWLRREEAGVELAVLDELVDGAVARAITRPARER